MNVTVSAVDWLLESAEPGIVAQAKRDLLDEPAPAEGARILEGPKVRGRPSLPGSPARVIATASRSSTG